MLPSNDRKPSLHDENLDASSSSKLSLPAPISCRLIPRVATQCGMFPTIHPYRPIIAPMVSLSSIVTDSSSVSTFEMTRFNDPPNLHLQRYSNKLQDDSLEASPAPTLSVSHSPTLTVPHDGFQAWLVVFSAFCTFSCSFGVTDCIGVSQPFYKPISSHLMNLARYLGYQVQKPL